EGALALPTIRPVTQRCRLEVRRELFFSRCNYLEFFSLRPTAVACSARGACSTDSITSTSAPFPAAFNSRSRREIHSYPRAIFDTQAPKASQIAGTEVFPSQSTPDNERGIERVRKVRTL